MTPDHLVRNRCPFARHFLHRLARPFHRLADGFRYLVGFAGGHTDLARAVTDRHEGAEREAPATFDDLGDPVDCDHVLDHGFAVCAAFTSVPSLLSIVRHP